MTASVLDPGELERRRLAALHEYRLLDAPADDELSAVVRVAAMVADVPTATLNLIDEHRQCQLTTVGFEGGNSARSDSMCDIQLRQGNFVHVPDAREHPLYAANPWVDGRMANVRFYASAPLIAPNGYALGTLCVFDDVVKELSPRQIERLTDLADVLVGLFERRRQGRLAAEMAITAERSRKFAETLVDTVDVGIVAADEQGQLTILNRSVRRWGGALESGAGDLAEIAGRLELLRPDGVTEVPQESAPLFRALREDINVDNEELVLRTADDALLTLTASARSMIADNGERIGAVVALTDVTKERDHLRQIQDLVTELQRSNDELEGFAAAVSHDLVRPLAGARGYLEMLNETYGDVMDDRARKWMSGAVAATDRMQQLVQALLSYARAGHAPAATEPVDLQDVLAHVRTDLRTLIESTGATVTVHKELPTVTGDPTLLRQLLQNLIDNAIKYRHPDRAPHVQVAGHLETAGWEITVTDNGLGIPSDQRDRVFDMFAQVDPTSRKGHGIGLSTCLRIAERYNGRITIDDAPGGGTVLRLHLAR
ncbi:sensor histidine kinase [Paractinoplanes atraurantiacus]|uniref:Sensor-like histidine kinase SenX3 n=1 Tax=Paractinoplanes atraurantiacus TaxID=1036182 RepID=A0A285I1Q2_9ACTN|nr:ATP-binding protein [Actinoplanes atraurantiacus]SNY41895.1 His Kinase A (phospho-acceptor) domain-containing protein [Actinoplanes atraurantiacus]